MVAIKKNVLVVDDEDVVRRSYQRVLSDAGYDVVSACDGREALHELEDHDYDLVLTDLKMPGDVDGLGIVERLRATNPNVPVIVVTGYPSPATFERAGELGVAQYLTKPVTPAQLVQKAEQALSDAIVPGRTVERRPAPPEAPKSVDPPREAQTPTKELEGPMRVLRDLGILIAAPFAGLAYVLFLPAIGFAMGLGIAGKGAWNLATRRGKGGVR